MSDRDLDSRFERTFTLRLWREPGVVGDVRGSLIELGSGRRFFFTTLSDLKDFLVLRLDERS
jgi:hypothetical protein